MVEMLYKGPMTGALGVTVGSKTLVVRLPASNAAGPAEIACANNHTRPSRCVSCPHLVVPAARVCGPLDAVVDTPASRLPSVEAQVCL